MIGISVRGAREKALSMEKENKNKRNQNANGTQSPRGTCSVKLFVSLGHRHRRVTLSLKSIKA